MSASCVEQVYRYSHASVLDREGGTLHLATSDSGGDAHPHFFTGSLTRPDRTAKLLLALMDVVHARYHVPAAMLERILTQADPVVTSGVERLRFEGFSACCGAYARVDLHPEAMEGETFGRGTTNVDFNPPMLAALATLGPNDAVSMAVGKEGVTLETGRGAVVEKRVKLPVRWLKGFVEVQEVQRRMRPVLECSGPEATRFLRGLPRMRTSGRETWVQTRGRGLAVAHAPPRGPAVRIGGLERLRPLERVASQARALRVHQDEATGASGWTFVFDDCRFHLVLSPEVWRGFSGEGQALDGLARERWRGVLRTVRAQLGWSSTIEPAELARRAGVEEGVAVDALAALGARGLVGFDLESSAYFHRELPFDLSAVEEMQPRLRGARKLVTEGRARIETRSADAVDAFVSSGGVEHRVRLTPDGDRCSCPWYAKHQGARGPCKHVLASRMLLEEGDGRR